MLPTKPTLTILIVVVDLTFIIGIIIIIAAATTIARLVPWLNLESLTLKLTDEFSWTRPDQFSLVQIGQVHVQVTTMTYVMYKTVRKRALIAFLIAENTGTSGLVSTRLPGIM